MIPIPDELDRLEALARSIEDGGWYNADFLACFIDGDDEQVFPDADAAFIAACDPDTIRRLIAAARRSLP
jgi:hypothetical protein